MNRFLLIVSIFFVTISTSAQSRTGALPAGQPPVARFYPNPASSIINIDIQKNYEQGYSIQIFNAILGRKMYEKANIPERMNVDLANYSRGIYIYQIRDKSGRMIDSGKFQVAK